MSRLFDGTDDYVTGSFGPVSSYPFTMAVWTKQTTPSDAVTRLMMVMGTASSNDNRWGLFWLGNGSAQFSSRTTTSVTATSSSLVADTNWHLVVGVGRSATDRQVYVDSLTNTGTNVTSNTPAAPNAIRLGAGLDATLDYNGKVAHASVWNAALSDNELQMLFNRTSPIVVRPSALVMYAPFMGRSTDDADIMGNRVLTATSSTSDPDEPPLLWIPRKRTSIVSSAVGGVPQFTVDPTVSSETSSAYTLSGTANQSATWYAAVVPVGTATPSKAQIIAGTGGGIIAAANKSVSGADTLVVGGSLTFPLHNIHSVLSNVNGDGDIESLTSQYLDPPAGKQFVVFDVPLSGTAIDALVNASPSIADGDVLVIDTVTDPGGYAVSASAQGDVDVNVMGDSSRQLIDFDVYDLSLQAYYGAGQLAINNQGPEVVGNPSELARFYFDRNETITPEDLTVYFDDPELDLLVVTSTDTALSDIDLAVTNSELVGTTPNENSITTGITIRGTDPYGGYIEGDITILIGDVVVPNVVGQDSSSGAGTLASAYLGSEVVSSIPSLQPAGTILFQNPAAESEVAPNTIVQLTVSSGQRPQPPVKTRLSDLPEVITKHRRRRVP